MRADLLLSSFAILGLGASGKPQTGEQCNDLELACANGTCVSQHAWCNGINDCADGSDESYTNCVGLMATLPKRRRKDISKENTGTECALCMAVLDVKTRFWQKKFEDVRNECSKCDKKIIVDLHDSKLQSHKIQKTNEMHNETDDMLVDLKMKEVEVENLKNRIKSMRHELDSRDKVKTDLDIVSSDLKRVLQENVLLKNDSAHRDVLVKTLLANVTECSSQSQLLQNNAKDINEKLDSMRIIISDLKKDVENKTNIFTDNIEELESMRIIISDLKKDVENKTNIITDNNDELKSMRIIISDFENDVENKTNVIIDLSKKFDKSDLETQKWHSAYLQMKSEKLKCFERHNV